MGHNGEEKDGRQASTARQTKGQVVDKAHKTEEGGERRERGESGNDREHVPATQAYYCPDRVGYSAVCLRGLAHRAER